MSLRSAAWTSHAPVAADTFRRISQSLISSRQLCFAYISPATNRITMRSVEPHHLQYYMASWVHNYTSVSSGFILFLTRTAVWPGWLLISRSSRLACRQSSFPENSARRISTHCRHIILPSDKFVRVTNCCRNRTGCRRLHPFAEKRGRHRLIWSTKHGKNKMPDKNKPYSACYSTLTSFSRRLPRSILTRSVS